MSKYQTFIFKDYIFEPDSKSLTFTYSFDDELDLNEVYKFDFEYADYDRAVFDRALQLLFFMAGVSYYKAYLPPKIEIRKGKCDEKLAGFLTKTYRHGLGEFFFVNKLDPHTKIEFPAGPALAALPQGVNREGMQVGIGGGKDSLVSVELLRDKVADLSTWSVGHCPQLSTLVERIGLPHFWVERAWDPQLLELNKQDALNGHIPISAILACAGTVTAILAGKRDVVVSNEQSANEPTLHYQGMAINHQYSKSQEFEQDFQAILRHLFGEQVRYYSLLRPLSEVRIAELFAKTGFDKYHDVFSSCNRAFTHDRDHIFWDGTCPKCAFVFLALTPFVGHEKLETLFGSKNLLLDPALEPIYRQLLGIEGDKPLECVGEIKESRAAMRQAQQQYPELSKYEFELPEDYSYKTLGPHEMPEEVYELFIERVSDV